MTTPTIEEMHETWSAAWDADIDRQGGGEGADHDAIVRAAWSAVIEKHFGPMLERAYFEGAGVTHNTCQQAEGAAHHYAEFIIEQMKEQP